MLRSGGALAGFGVFGGLWGTWGAAIPAVRDQAGVDEAALGAALLLVGAGALPAMLLTGRVLDRLGPVGRTRSLLLVVALAAAGVLLALAARSPWSLAACLAVVGATSGAADVALNVRAAGVEAASGRPVVVRGHAAFSGAVVVSSLGTGGLLALGAPLLLPFGLVAAAAAALGLALLRAPGAAAAPAAATAPAGAGAAAPLPRLSLLLLGTLAALAFAVENAHQSWSAVFLADETGAGPATAAAGPAVFAAVVAATRTALSVRPVAPLPVLTAGAALAAAGTALLAASSGVVVALAGLALAAAGTAVLFPTLVVVVASRVGEEARGRATSLLSVVGYVGFLAGPVLVGGAAAAVGLPGALGVVAGVAVLLALATAPVLRLSRRPVAPPAVR
jgi:hypothetical protein